MRSSVKYKLSTLAVVLALLAVLPLIRADSARAQSDLMRLIVPYGPGGGYDLYTRIVARHLGKYLPGNPKVIVQNMPGAGGLVGLSYLYNIAKPDGKTLMTVVSYHVINQLLGLAGVNFDWRKLAWISNLAPNATVLVIRGDLPYKTFEDMKRAKKPVAFGSVGGTDNTAMVPAVIGKATGVNLKIVPGYASTAYILAAMDRGEVDGLAFSFYALKAQRKKDLEKGLLRPVLQLGLKRHPEMAEVPLASELVSPKYKPVIDLFTGLDVGMRSYFGPPGVPPERIKILREAFDKLIRDPGFQANLKKVSLALDPMSGDEVEKLQMEAIGAATPDTLNLIKEALGLP